MGIATAQILESVYCHLMVPRGGELHNFKLLCCECMEKPKALSMFQNDMILKTIENNKSLETNNAFFPYKSPT